MTLLLEKRRKNASWLGGGESLKGEDSEGFGGWLLNAWRFDEKDRGSGEN